MTSSDILLLYQQRLQELQSLLPSLQSRQSMLLAAFAVTALAFLATYALAAYRAAPLPVAPILLLPPAAYLLKAQRRLHEKSSSIARLITFYLDRSRGTSNHDGAQFAPQPHPYSADLNLFGPGSLFQRLCNARTVLGHQRLADFLLTPTNTRTALERQQAVRELAPRAELRERLTLLGNAQHEPSSLDALTDWQASEPIANARAFQIALRITSTAIALLVFVAFLFPVNALAVAIPLLLIQALLAFRLRRAVLPLLDSAGALDNDLRVVREGLDFLSRQSFSSSTLQSIVRTAAQSNQAIARLHPWFRILIHRPKDWFYQLSLLFGLGTQAALAIDLWRAKNTPLLHNALDAWAQFEALSSLATYAYENPEDAWPQFTEAPALFHAQALGHPLIPRSVCVANQVHLDMQTPFALITGSNMAGKSTFLRSIGIANVLALAGAPVRAASLVLSPLHLHASITTSDSLLEGKSRFLMEISRLRDALAAAAERPVLFLFDEILGGTNSTDRSIAADAILGTLHACRAIGVVTTHDVALATITRHGGANLHMSAAGSDPLNFDYKLKPGIATHSNALAIARLVGVPL
jgi:hypothetical protein